MKKKPHKIEKTLLSKLDALHQIISAIIDGHGGGCVGCAHPPKNLKSPDTPPCRRQRGCAPYGVGLGAKKIFSHPGVGGGKKNFSAAKRRRNFSRIFFTKILKFF